MTLRSVTSFDITGERTKDKPPRADRLRRSMSRILKKTPLCAIATVGADRRSHVNTAYFAYSSTLDLYFLSHPASQHCLNIRANPTIAIAVFESAQTWGGLDRGLQLFGTCRETRGAEARRAEQVYARRFKPYARWKADLDVDDTARAYRFYRFVTKRLKLFDEREFGGATFVTATVVRGRR